MKLSHFTALKQRHINNTAMQALHKRMHCNIHLIKDTINYYRIILIKHTSYSQSCLYIFCPRVNRTICVPSVQALKQIGERSLTYSVNSVYAYHLTVYCVFSDKIRPCYILLEYKDAVLLMISIKVELIYKFMIENSGFYVIKR